MRNRVSQTDWRTYLDASMFPLKIFTVVAAVWIVIWRAHVPADDSDPSHWAAVDFNAFAGAVAAGYILSGLVMLVGGIIQAGYSSRRAWIWSLSFAVAALIIGIWMANYQLPTMTQNIL